MAIQTVGIVGAGSMGSGIANLAASAGYQVILRDVEEQFIESGLSRIDKFMSKSVEKEKITVDEKQKVIGRIKTTTDIEDLKYADIVIEAIIEDMDAKKSVFAELDRVISENVILVTNTSSLSITEIANATARTDRVAGMHFFNPAQLMKLVEIVRGYNTSDTTVEELQGFAKSLSKEPVVVNKDVPGFIVNRIMVPQFIEAIKLVEEGVASPEDIDKAVTLGLNYPMGPFTLQDYAGVDIGYYVMEYMADEFNDTRFAPPMLMKQMMRAGRIGKKSGAGFYDYE
ncbi:3-hydroxyacyl-CoA dehydrogenase family protein [Pseudogracilibacillus sp. SO30301A]|uniref:3-hydroxyacyl-CoA dehydrogenase family protein n=1 Tax=Pseudogracilibacillus sp. SO30301A TaxID=3098291 RepID=UPI00300E0A05